MGASALSILSPDSSEQSPTSALLQDDDSVNLDLLIHHDSSSPSPKRPAGAIFVFMVITTCISVSTAIAFGFLFFISPTNTNHHPAEQPLETSRTLQKLQKPAVILISTDGFRFGYQFKTPTPNIHRLISNGTEAVTGLISVFPTLTFPNHYSIATGLYPAWHGIINNHFKDPVTNDSFNMQSHESKWWLGEPIWETVVNNGLKAATYFWPGSEVHKGKWDCPPKYCKNYDGSVPFKERVDTVLSYFDLPDEERPAFMTLYFEDPDHQGHQVGPDDPLITEAVARIDQMIGRLIAGLEKRRVFEDVTIIMVGDHGMVGTCDGKLIFLDDLAPWVEVQHDWVQSYSPLLAIRPPPGFSPADVVTKMNKGLSSGKVKNGENLKVFLKEDLPSRLHYADSYRIPPIIGLVAEGYKVEQKRSKRQECGGAHGYDNEFFSMRTIFIGHGPQFARGRKVPSFENVEIYNLIASILNLKVAPNNGTASFFQLDSSSCCSKLKMSFMDSKFVLSGC